MKNIFAKKLNNQQKQGNKDQQNPRYPGNNADEGNLKNQAGSEKKGIKARESKGRDSRGYDGEDRQQLQQPI